MASTDWSGRRWVVCVGVILLAQLLLIWLVAEKVQKPKPRGTPETTFRVVPERLDQRTIATRLFASDPDVFAAASLPGAAARDWSRLRSPEYNMIPEAEEPIQMLKLDPADLASQLPKGERKGPFPFDYRNQPQPAPETVRLFVETEMVKTQSVLRVEGLVARKCDMPESLPAWAHSDVLTNSVVQIGINDLGQVVSARLLARCGLAAADQHAVAVAQSLRFDRVTGGSSTPLQWGRVIFEWQAVPLPPESKARSLE